MLLYYVVIYCLTLLAKNEEFNKIVMGGLASIIIVGVIVK